MTILPCAEFTSLHETHKISKYLDSKMYGKATFVLFAFSWFLIATAFNIDTRSAKSFKGTKNGEYFGYSVAFHKSGAKFWYVPNLFLLYLRFVAIQGRACHTEDDGPSFVQKPVVHEKFFHHLCPKNWSFLITNLHCFLSSI